MKQNREENQANPKQKGDPKKFQNFGKLLQLQHLVDSFVLTFSINEDCPALDVAIRVIHTKVFDDKEIAEYQPDWKE